MNKAPVTYKARFVYQPSNVFAFLWRQVPWEKREDAPRREAWFNPYGEPYTYGSGDHARTYEAHDLNPNVSNAGWIISEVMDRLNKEFDANFDCCFVNGYEHGRQHLGWHSDDSPEMDMDHPIATVSLGVPREIWFRLKPVEGRLDAPGRTTALTNNTVDKLTLANGSVALMHAGMQRHWQHRIPKDHKGEDCGPRISLTYRRLVR